MARPLPDRAEAFRDFVLDTAFPCLGAQGAVRAGGHWLAVYGALGDEAGAADLATDLRAFLLDEHVPGPYRAFVAVFPARPPADELAFERRLWRQLRRLHERDDPGAAWDPGASDDPEDPYFSFSFAGHACFVVGLHPRSSRLARRFRWPALVFNPRAQFERLRAEGRYDRLKNAIRARELALQGDLNPNLADFGERSEARQYSGRAVEADWRCPFQPGRHRE